MERSVIREASGNLLTADVDALVNTVNTVGVMGKGIALQFKRAYPDMFHEYELAAKAGTIVPGRMHVWETDALEGPRFVINFPTKRHWREKSRMEDIQDGLNDLAQTVETLGIQSIAVPPLGCGNGGLDWSEVRPLIDRALGSLPIDVVVYPPIETPAAAAMIDRRPSPRLNDGRVALLRIMRAYLALTLEAPSVLEIQKLMYFLQAAGQPLRLRYVKGRYGPYADSLRHVLTELEGHYVVGFGDGSAKVNEAEPLRLLPAGMDAADSRVDPATEARISRVLDLAEGYSTPYGMELLASVHWVAGQESIVMTDPIATVAAVQSWNLRKHGLFSPEHISRAWRALAERNWITSTAAITAR